jgi:hypothetical protein
MGLRIESQPDQAAAAIFALCLGVALDDDAAEDDSRMLPVTVGDAVVDAELVIGAGVFGEYGGLPRRCRDRQIVRCDGGQGED